METAVCPTPGFSKSDEPGTGKTAVSVRGVAHGRQGIAQRRRGRGTAVFEQPELCVVIKLALP